MQIAERDELRAGDSGDVPLELLAHVNQGDLLAGRELCLKFLDGDLGDGGLDFQLFFGGSCLRDAAEGVVVDELCDGGIVAADGALGITARLELAEAHLQRIKGHESADEWITDSDDQLNRLDCLHHADDTGEHPEDTSFGAARDHAWRRWLGIETAVAGTAEMRGEDRTLSVKAEDGAVDIGLLLEDADVIGEVAGREIIRAVDDDVVGGNDLGGVFGGEEAVVEIDLHVRVDRLDRILGTVDLLAAHVGRAVKDLALEVGEINRVEVNQPDAADAGGSEIEGDRGAEATRTDAEYGGGLELLLTFEGDLRHDEMSRVARDLVVAQFDALGAGRIQDAFAHEKGD